MTYISVFFQNYVILSTQNSSQIFPMDGWNKMESNQVMYILALADEICGWSKGGRQRHNETWHWNDNVDEIIKQKLNGIINQKYGKWVVA